MSTCTNRRTKCGNATMVILLTQRLTDGPRWLHENRFDGYRSPAIKLAGKVHLRSRNDNDPGLRHPDIV
jgi:ATP-dependent DNA ligase